MKCTYWAIVLLVSVAGVSHAQYSAETPPYRLEQFIGYRFFDEQGKALETPNAADINNESAIAYASYFSGGKVQRVERCLHYGSLTHDACYVIWKRR